MKYWIRYIAFILGFFTAANLYSQVNEIEAAIEIILKHQMEDEANEEKDQSSIIDQLEFLREHPVNFNSSNLIKLTDIGLMNFHQYTKVQDHIKNHGRIMALEELVQIEAFDVSYIRIIKPFPFNKVKAFLMKTTKSSCEII